MGTTTRLFHLPLFLAACLALLPCALPVGNAGTLEPVTLQLKWFHQFQFAGYYAALDQGYYRDAGLDVTIQERDAEQDAVAEVLKERAQFGVASAELLLRALNDAPLTVLAAIFQHSPLVLVTHTDSGILTPHDCIGRTVKMTLHPRNVELQAMFLNEGVDLGDLVLTQSETDKADYLNSNISAVPAYVTNEPYYMAIEGIDYRIILPRTYGIDFYGDCLFTSANLLEHRPDLVTAFRAASLRGWEYAMAHPDEIIDLILSEYSSKKPRAHLEFEAEAMQQLILPSLVEMGHINPGRWQHMADTFLALGMADEPPDAAFWKRFLYDPANAQNVSRLYRIIWGLTAVILAVGLIALLLAMFVRRLRREIRQREKAEAALTESELLHRTIFENTGTGMCIIEPDNTILLANKKFLEMTGHTIEEVQGRAKWTDMVHADDLKVMLDRRARRIKGEAPPASYEFRLVTASENIRYILLTLGTLNDEGKIITSLNDITPRILAEQAREDLIGELKTKNDELERFSYTVSHDLKSPLITIKGFLGLIEQEPTNLLSKNVQSHLARINAAADTMHSLLDEILRLSHIESKKALPIELDLNKLAREAKENIHGLLLESGGKVNMAPGLPKAIGDRCRLLEVFQNLLENALKYRSPDRAPVIDVFVRNQHDETVICVRDNGIGIAPQYADRVFLLFEQLNPEINGTGIGLALVKRIVGQHGGRIWVESDGPDTGSTFCFTLGEPT